MIAGVNPKKNLTLYNGFLGFKETKNAQSIVHNVLKEYWNGANGKQGCKGKTCHKLRIDATRSCDQESICRITKFDQTWSYGKTDKTYTIGKLKTSDKSGLSNVSHGSISKVSMYVGSHHLTKAMFVLSNKQEISDLCLIDINGTKKCLFNSGNSKDLKVDSKYQIAFQNSKENGAVIQGFDTRYIKIGRGEFLSGLRPWYIVQ